MGAILIVLLAVIGFTIPQLRQCISVHLFVGIVLIGPVLLKMASTGYRFVRYYAGNAEYRSKGPPELVLRLIGPVIMISTVAVFITGVMLLIVGPQHRDWSNCPCDSRAADALVAATAQVASETDRPTARRATTPDDNNRRFIEVPFSATRESKSPTSRLIEFVGGA